MTWSRWAPSGITGRIALLVVGAVFLAQALTGAVLYWTRPAMLGFEGGMPSFPGPDRPSEPGSDPPVSGPRPAPARGLAGFGIGGPGPLFDLGPGRPPPRLGEGFGAAAIRLASLAQALASDPAPAAGNLAPVLRRHGFSLQSGPGDLGPPETASGPAGLAAAILHGELGDTQPFRVGLRGDPPTGQRVALAIRLRDTQWLTAEVPAPAPPPAQPGMFRPAVLVPLIFMVVTVILLTAWVSLRVTAPLISFADAAERLGTEGSAPHLPETGPAEIRRAALAFNRMQDRIRRFVADRTRMLAAISHDLRTPITRLRLRAEAVDDAEQRDKIIADLATMEQMIRSALAFIRSEGEGEPVERVDLAALLETCCDERVDMGHDASYHGPSAIIARCRPQALARAIGNLVDNAVQFGGTAQVGLHVLDAERIEITVADSGPGIPASQRDAVFEPFHRLDNARGADTGGIGLGLAIARTIVREHGGDIRLEDNCPRGLLVRISLPMRTESRASDPDWEA